jgi:hypothetical protein
MEGLTMPDTTEAMAAITRLITTGTPATALIATVATTFPSLTPAEFSVALQCAQAQAEKHAARKH